MAKNFQRSLAKQGIKFALNTKVISASKDNSGNITVSVEGAKDGKKEDVWFGFIWGTNKNLIFLLNTKLRKSICYCVFEIFVYNLFVFC